MRIYAFRAGKFAGLRSRSGTLATAMEWGAQAFDYMPGPVAAVVATQLIVRVRGCKMTHRFARREKHEPNTIFVGMVSDAVHDRLMTEARAARWARDKVVRQHVEDMTPLAAQIVNWEDLSPKLQARCAGSNLSVTECWIWRPSRRRNSNTEVGKRPAVAPYAQFYASIKGPVPAGVHLRHKCDNPPCVNPNHLEPGTAAQNVQDMMARGRHAAQQRALKRAKGRAAYRLRKEKKLGVDD